MSKPKMLDVDAPQATCYCIPIWLRDEQIKINVARPGIGRIAASEDRPDRIAVVGFGASLKHTWEGIKDFKYIITCSGSHKFLLERGIVPTWHIEVDPREHKLAMLGTPHPEVTYVPASCVHPKYYDALAGFKVEMWHVYETDREAKLKVPRGEWAVTGGCDVGQRAMAMARFFGFTDLHIFGIDGCGEEGVTDRRHAAEHPLQDGKPMAQCEYPKGSGRLWHTTGGMLEAARGIWHELDMMPSVKAIFYGEGLVQTMAQHYVKKNMGRIFPIAENLPILISEEYRSQQAQLHRENLAFGVGGGKHAQTVERLKIKLGAASVLDYGCGKGYLAKGLKFPIWEYDPAIPGKDAPPRPAELVVCTDVLEHIEPDKIDYVLDDLRRCVKKIGFFVIHTGPSSKTLPDGRNAHLIQEPEAWWRQALAKYFHVADVKVAGPLLYCVVAPSKARASRAA